jgi:putative ABC transport system permease protein
MDTVLQHYTAPSTIVSSLLGVFSAGSLLIAGIGLYAVIAFHTARRSRESGIRLALGATAADVQGTVLREGLLLSALGCAIGLALSVTAAQLLRGLLFGVSALDPLTQVLVLGLLAAVTLIALYVPARRAARIEPLEALRQE